MKLSRQVTVTLCLDPEKLALPLFLRSFYRSKETYLKLLALADQEKVPLEDPSSWGGKNAARFKTLQNWRYWNRTGGSIGPCPLKTNQKV